MINVSNWLSNSDVVYSEILLGDDDPIDHLADDAVLRSVLQTEYFARLVPNYRRAPIDNHKLRFTISTIILDFGSIRI